ncbi:MAG: hypothetical protein IPP96_15775 [Chitinophagaceae bacterium]|nr:hypothetical protein [Chitinophagaceae bacterium]
MKQKLILFSLMLLVTISGCRKDMPAEEPVTSPDPLGAQHGDDNDGPRQCRLIFDDRDGVYGNFFHYNKKGLVDNWKVDYYDGYPDVYNFTYDNRDHLKTGRVVFNYNGSSFDLKYQYQGDKLIRETWYAAGTNTIVDDIVNTYNSRDQIIKRRSIPKNIYCTFTYDFLGNNPLVNFYVDDELYLKEEYTHHKFNRNPLTSLNGIPVVLPYYDFVISNWWETSQKWTVYDEGTPTVIVDLDPKTVVMKLGRQDYLKSVSNFDRAIQQNTKAVFEYENCGKDDLGEPSANDNMPAGKNQRTAIIAKFKRALLPGQSNDIKNEVKELKRKLSQVP